MTIKKKKGFFTGSKVLIEDSRLRDSLWQKGFGEKKQRILVLDLFEAAYLYNKKKLEVFYLNGRKVSKRKLIEAGVKENKNFYSFFVVYTDLKGKGYVVKTGFKFGCTFRVYAKGKKPGEEHSKWSVTVLTQHQKKSMNQLSLLTRMAQTLNTIALIAVVDSENEVNYYSVKRITL